MWKGGIARAKDESSSSHLWSKAILFGRCCIAFGQGDVLEARVRLARSPALLTPPSCAGGQLCPPDTRAASPPASSICARGGRARGGAARGRMPRHHSCNQTTPLIPEGSCIDMADSDMSLLPPDCLSPLPFWRLKILLKPKQQAFVSACHVPRSGGASNNARVSR